jgi:hypothetical protein
MRIAFDLDGVLADLHTPFVQTAARLFPGIDPVALTSADIAASPPPEEEPAAEEGAERLVPSPPTVVLTRRQTEVVWRDIARTENFWESLDEIEPGAVSTLARVADERGWEVLFVTSRPRSAGRTVQRQSQRWLEARGFPLPSLYVVHGSRGRIADALAIDVVVDDRPDNCLDIVLESKAGALLVWRGPAASVPISAKRLGIAVVPTVASVVDALVQAERATDGFGVLDRLRRLFGLKTRSASPLVR